MEISIKIIGSGKFEDLKKEILSQLDHLSTYTKDQLSNGGELEDENSFLEYSEAE